MVKITAGPELDRAVAEACGWFGKVFAPHGDEEFFYLSLPQEGHPDYLEQWSPSIDLNAAFTAAERLIGEYPHIRVESDGEDRWSCFFSDDPLRRIEATAPTPALAICAAILKLKEAE